MDEEGVNSIVWQVRREDEFVVEKVNKLFSSPPEVLMCKKEHRHRL